MDLPLHPTLNASLNLLAAILLWQGRRAVLAGNTARHRNLMVAALTTSAVFLTSYLIYHYTQPVTKYPHEGALRALYYLILIPHVILATAMVPFILAAVTFAFQGKFARHRALVRWVWPVWMYVSVTGVIVYLMLYVFV
jgi:putative membrane protein